MPAPPPRARPVFWVLTDMLHAGAREAPTAGPILSTAARWAGAGRFRSCFKSGVTNDFFFQLRKKRKATSTFPAPATPHPATFAAATILLPRLLGNYFYVINVRFLVYKCLISTDPAASVCQGTRSQACGCPLHGHHFGGPLRSCTQHAGLASWGVNSRGPDVTAGHPRGEPEARARGGLAHKQPLPWDPRVEYVGQAHRTCPGGCFSRALTSPAAHLQAPRPCLTRLTSACTSRPTPVF